MGFDFAKGSRVSLTIQAEMLRRRNEGNVVECGLSTRVHDSLPGSTLSPPVARL